jgi:hypothetical protein
MIAIMVERKHSRMKELQLMAFNRGAGITPLNGLNLCSPQLTFTTHCLLSRGSHIDTSC